MAEDWQGIVKSSLEGIRWWNERMPIEILDKLVGLIGREDREGWE